VLWLVALVFGFWLLLGAALAPCGGVLASLVHYLSSGSFDFPALINRLWFSSVVSPCSGFFGDPLHGLLCGLFGPTLGRLFGCVFGFGVLIALARNVCLYHSWSYSGTGHHAYAVAEYLCLVAAA
jgi:hypothetical protein